MLIAIICAAILSLIVVAWPHRRERPLDRDEIRWLKQAADKHQRENNLPFD
jgi:hypothetical protein